MSLEREDIDAMDGKELRAIRERISMGQKEFAGWLGINANYLWRLENEDTGTDGEVLKPSKTLERLAILLEDDRNRKKIVSIL